MNHITIELCAEDRARLDRIAALLEGKSCTCKPVKAEPKTEPAVTEEVGRPTSTQPEPKKATTPEPVTQAPKDEDVPPVSLSDIQALVVKLATTGGKKVEARAVVTKYAARVTEIPEDKYVAVYDELKKLED